MLAGAYTWLYRRAESVSSLRSRTNSAETLEADVQATQKPSLLCTAACPQRAPIYNAAVAVREFVIRNSLAGGVQTDLDVAALINSALFVAIDDGCVPLRPTIISIKRSAAPSSNL